MSYCLGRDFLWARLQPMVNMRDKDVKLKSKAGKTNYKQPSYSQANRSGAIRKNKIRKRTGGELKEYKHYSQANRRGTFKNTNIIRKRTGGELKKIFI